VFLQEEEYRQRQYGEVDRNPGDAQEAETQGLQGQGPGQGQGEVMSSSSMDVSDLAGRQGTLGSGYFDAAGNWQTYDLTAIAEEPSQARYGTHVMPCMQPVASAVVWPMLMCTVLCPWGGLARHCGQKGTHTLSLGL